MAHNFDINQVSHTGVCARCDQSLGSNGFGTEARREVDHGGGCSIVKWSLQACAAQCGVVWERRRCEAMLSTSADVVTLVSGGGVREPLLEPASKRGYPLPTPRGDTLLPLLCSLPEEWDETAGP